MRENLIENWVNVSPETVRIHLSSNTLDGCASIIVGSALRETPGKNYIRAAIENTSRIINATIQDTIGDITKINSPESIQIRMLVTGLSGIDFDIFNPVIKAGYDIKVIVIDNNQLNPYTSSARFMCYNVQVQSIAMAMYGECYCGIIPAWNHTATSTGFSLAKLTSYVRAVDDFYNHKVGNWYMPERIKTERSLDEYLIFVGICRNYSIVDYLETCETALMKSQYCNAVMLERVRKIQKADHSEFENLMYTWYWLNRSVSTIIREESPVLFQFTPRFDGQELLEDVSIFLPRFNMCVVEISDQKQDAQHSEWLPLVAHAYLTFNHCVDVLFVINNVRNTVKFWCINNSINCHRVATVNGGTGDDISGTINYTLR